MIKRDNTRCLGNAISLLIGSSWVTGSRSEVQGGQGLKSTNSEKEYAYQVWTLYRSKVKA